MAIAISKTPTLRSKEAVKFQKIAKANESICAPKKEVMHALKTFINVVKKQEKPFRVW